MKADEQPVKQLSTPRSDGDYHSQFLNTLWQNVREEFENEISSEEYDFYVSQIFQC